MTSKKPSPLLLIIGKTYGDGDAAVTAASRSKRWVGVPASLDHGSERFRKVNADALHCRARSTHLGQAFIGDTLLADLKDKKLTELRRSEVGFIFQSFNLVPTLTAEENINLPMSLGGRNGREWIDTVIDTVIFVTALPPPERTLWWTAAARCRRSRLQVGRRSSSPTNRPATQAKLR